MITFFFYFLQEKKCDVYRPFINFQRTFPRGISEEMGRNYISVNLLLSYSSLIYNVGDTYEKG